MSTNVPISSASAFASPSAAGPVLGRVKRDGEVAVEGIGPFDENLLPGERLRRVEAALEVCGGPRRAYSFDSNPDEDPLPSERFALCRPRTHAKLLATFASFEVNNQLPLPPRQQGIGTIGGGEAPKAPTRREDAAGAFRLALALNPTIRAPADANDGAQQAFAMSKRGPRPAIRIAEPVTPREETFEQALREALPSFRLCYAAGLANNPDLYGSITIDASLEQDGWLSNVTRVADVPDLGVVSCIARFADRLVIPGASGAAKPVRFKLVVSPESESSK